MNFLDKIRHRLATWIVPSDCGIVCATAQLDDNDGIFKRDEKGRIESLEPVIGKSKRKTSKLKTTKPKKRT